MKILKTLSSIFSHEGLLGILSGISGLVTVLAFLYKGAWIGYLVHFAFSLGHQVSLENHSDRIYLEWKEKLFYSLGLTDSWFFLLLVCLFFAPMIVLFTLSWRARREGESALQGRRAWKRGCFLSALSFTAVALASPMLYGALYLDQELDILRPIHSDHLHLAFPGSGNLSFSLRSRYQSIQLIEQAKGSGEKAQCRCSAPFRPLSKISLRRLAAATENRAGATLGEAIGKDDLASLIAHLYSEQGWSSNRAASALNALSASMPKKWSLFLDFIEAFNQHLHNRESLYRSIALVMIEEAKDQPQGSTEQSKVLFLRLAGLALGRTIEEADDLDRLHSLLADEQKRIELLVQYAREHDHVRLEDELSRIESREARSLAVLAALSEPPNEDRLIRTLETLLEGQADLQQILDQKNEQGHTPLLAAIHLRSERAVEYLISKGAPALPRDDQQQDALQSALGDTMRKKVWAAADFIHILYTVKRGDRYDLFMEPLGGRGYHEPSKRIALGLKEPAISALVCGDRLMVFYQKKRSDRRLWVAHGDMNRREFGEVEVQGIQPEETAAPAAWCAEDAIGQPSWVDLYYSAEKDEWLRYARVQLNDGRVLDDRRTAAKSRRSPAIVPSVGSPLTFYADRRSRHEVYQLGHRQSFGKTTESPVLAGCSAQEFHLLVPDQHGVARWQFRQGNSQGRPTQLLRGPAASLSAVCWDDGLGRALFYLDESAGLKGSVWTGGEYARFQSLSNQLSPRFRDAKSMAVVFWDPRS